MQGAATRKRYSFMAKRDFYEVLGVGKSADEKELKAAYRKLAKQLHPDANPGDKTADAKFKELNEAYDVLKDPQKKAAYDRFGHQAFEGGMGGGGRGPGGAGFGPEFNSSMSDIFEDLFGDFMGGGGARSRRGGGGRGGTGAARGADLRYNMEISLTEAFTGKTAQIRVPSSVSCETCNGTGAKPGSSPKTCGTCGGQGAVRSQSGFFTVERDLPHLPGPRPGHLRPLRLLRRPGPRHQGAHAFRQHSGRRRGRHAHPACERGRGGPARRAVGRSLHLPVGQAA